MKSSSEIRPFRRAIQSRSSLVHSFSIASLIGSMMLALRARGIVAEKRLYHLSYGNYGPGPGLSTKTLQSRARSPPSHESHPNEIYQSVYLSTVCLFWTDWSRSYPERPECAEEIDSALFEKASQDDVRIQG